MQRFFPLSLFLGQWKVLSDYRNEVTKPEWVSRSIVFGGPLVLFIVLLLVRTTVPDIGGVIAGTTILAGTLLAAFGQLSSWRVQLNKFAEQTGSYDQLERDSLDETVTHLLAAAYTSGVGAILLVLASNFGSTGADGESVGGLFLWAGLSFASHAGLTFLIAVPRLYYAYASLSEVRKELSDVY